jgi:hypothetical protein
MLSRILFIVEFYARNFPRLGGYFLRAYENSAFVALWHSNHTGVNGSYYSGCVVVRGEL